MLNLGSSSMPKSKLNMDLRVGERLRQGRVLANMSQEKIASALGVTFQQVQKYERGTNRISCGRLFEISKILNVPITYFFVEDDGERDREKPGALPALQPDAIRLAKSFSQIRSNKQRQLVARLVRELAEESESE